MMSFKAKNMQIERLIKKQTSLTPRDVRPALKAPARLMAIFALVFTLTACGGAKGNGTDVLVNTLTSITDEPAGDNCADGGDKIETGLDDNSDGVLDADEVDDTDYACNDDGFASLQGTIKLAGRSDHSGITISLAETGLSTKSDAEGGYTLANVPPGEYDIVFDAPKGSGYETGAKLYDYSFFTDIDDYDLISADLQLGRGILLSESGGTLVESGGHGGRYYYDYYNSQISPDSSRVVYVIYDEGGYSYLGNLYSVPLGGGTPKLLAGGAYDISLQISPDSSRVLYTKVFYSHGNSSGDIYSVLLGGGASTLLLEGGYSHLQISPDSSRVVYFGGDSLANLYSVPIGGGDTTLLAEGIDNSQISPDSSRVVYSSVGSMALYSSGDSMALYSVSIGGGTPILLEDQPHYFTQISPDSSYVVYSGGSRDLTNLYSVPIGGGTPTQLASNVYDEYMQISPDSSRLVYTVGGYFSSNLYSVPVVGGTTPILLAEGVNSLFVKISNNSARVVYNVGDDYSSANLYSVPLGGGTSILLAEGVYYSQISPDSSRVVYTDGNSSSGDLYSVPIGGGTPIPLASGIYYRSVHISPDSTSVLYSYENSNLFNLYSVPIGGGTPTQLASNVYAYSVKISPDSTGLIYSREFGVSTDNYDGYSSCLMSAPLP